MDGISVLQLLVLLLVLPLSTARDPKCDLLCEIPVEKGGCKCDSNCNCLRECFTWQVHTTEGAPTGCWGLRAHAGLHSHQQQSC